MERQHIKGNPAVRSSGEPVALKTGSPNCGGLSCPINTKNQCETSQILIVLEHQSFYTFSISRDFNRESVENIISNN